MASNAPLKKPRLGWPGAVGLVVSVVLLWWALRDVHVSEVAQHLRGVRVLPFVATVVVATLVFPLRTVRWRYLLRLDGEVLAFTPLWHATAIGFMANNLLPARTGEVARAYTASKLTSVRFTTAAATIAVERVMDGLTLVGMLAVAILFGGFTSATTIGGVPLGRVMLTAAGLFGILSAVALLTVSWPRQALDLARKIGGAALPASWSEKVVHAIEGLLEGLEVLRSWRRFSAVAFWSVVVWGTNGLSFWLCIQAFDLQIPTSAAFVLQSLIAFGVAIPSSPGFFGPFEAVSRATLAAYGTTPGAAVSYAVGYHFTTFIPITLLGLWSLTRAQLHLADLRKASPEHGSGGGRPVSPVPPR